MRTLMKAGLLAGERKSAKAVAPLWHGRRCADAHRPLVEPRVRRRFPCGPPSSTAARLIDALAPPRRPPHSRPMPAVLGHHHLAIQVKDLPAAERFYVEVLGLAVVKRWPRED